MTLLLFCTSKVGRGEKICVGVCMGAVISSAQTHTHKHSYTRWLNGSRRLKEVRDVLTTALQIQANHQKDASLGSSGLQMSVTEWGHKRITHFLIKNSSVAEDKHFKKASRHSDDSLAGASPQPAHLLVMVCAKDKTDFTLTSTFCFTDVHWAN